jgi:hypothetical protein
MSFVPSSTYLDKYFTEEARFCQLYPLATQQLNEAHWSPLLIINRAVRFLANQPGARILDIGSGCGKFCLAGAYYKPSAFFAGVEQRHYLAEQANAVRQKLGNLNVQFISGNFTQLDFRAFNGFYFYNSFFENVDGADTIDNSISYSIELYSYYNRVLCNKLYATLPGTRIVTYKSLGFEIPPGFSLEDAQSNGQLKFWIKKQ